MSELSMYDEICEVDGTWEDEYGGDHYWHCGQVITHECQEHRIRLCTTHHEEHILEYHPEKGTQWTLETTSESSGTSNTPFPE